MTRTTTSRSRQGCRALAAAALAVFMSSIGAQTGPRLSAECREGLQQLCASAAEPMRECIARHRDRLPPACLDDVAQRIRANMARRERDARPQLEAQAAALGAVEHSYGSDPAQRLDFYRAASTGKAPLMVFLHGGGWSRGDKRNATGFEKIRHLRGLGWHFASVDYRLVPRVTVEQQAEDVAHALAWLRGQANTLSIDVERIVLMGHSAGAHLAALVATDERHLRAAGLGFASLAGVVPVDGAAYDVPAQRESGSRILQDIYTKAFGDDPARQRSLSPTLRATSPGMPPFLILHVDRADAVRQSAGLADALREAGAKVQVENVGGTGARAHGEINRRLGDPSYRGTAVLDAWLASTIGKAR